MDDRSKSLEVINTVNEKIEQNIKFKVLIPEKTNFINEKKIFWWNWRKNFLSWEWS